MRTSQKARLIAVRKGIKRIGFKQKNPLGTIYYTNQKAIPIRGNYFGLENIESLAVRGFAQESWGKGELHGGNGIIAWGKVKFKGVSKAKTVAVKGYFHPSLELESHLKLVVERLRSSKAKHPKMCVFPLEIGGKKNLYLLMEPFFTKKGLQVNSKMEQAERVVNNIRLPNDLPLLKQVLNETAELAKAGLIVPTSLAVPRDFIALGLPHNELVKIAHKQIDVFNRIKLADGKTQIIAQDIDELKIANSPKDAWKESLGNVFQVVLENNRVPNGREMLNALAKEIELAHRL
jgi:hypothetical protein